MFYRKTLNKVAQQLNQVLDLDPPITGREPKDDLEEKIFAAAELYYESGWKNKGKLDVDVEITLEQFRSYYEAK